MWAVPKNGALGPHGEAAQASWTYQRREPEKTVLYQVVQEHLETLLAEARAHSEHGFGYPRYVEEAFYRYSQCGIFSRGFARCRCRDCGDEFLVPFSCKLRFPCPSCSSRRMHDTALRLVDLLPIAPYRQWVLSPPWPRRLQLVKDPTLMSALCRIFTQAIFCWLRKKARKMGISNPRPGAIANIHLFGSALNLHPHLHLVVPQGVFSEKEDGIVHFSRCEPPRDEEVAQIALTVYQRAEQMFEKKQTPFDDAPTDEFAPLASDLPKATQVPHASMPFPNEAWEHPAKQKRRCANANGYSLHADVEVRESDRKGLVHLICYGMRPAFALERLHLLDDGRVLYQLKRPWPHEGGVSQLVLEPIDFLRRLCCLMPPPKRHLIRYLGIFAPHSKLRNSLPKPPIEEFSAQCSTSVTPQPGQLSFPFVHEQKSDIEESCPSKTYRLLWAILLAKVFSIDILRCPKCGGERVLVAFIQDPPLIEKILSHLGLPTEPPPLTPARSPPQQEMDWGA